MINWKFGVGASLVASPFFAVFYSLFHIAYFIGHGSWWESLLFPTGVYVLTGIILGIVYLGVHLLVEAENKETQENGNV